MGVLFARAFTQQNLLDAWERVRDAALADGRPDRQVDIFEADAALRVVELSTALGLGEWRPSAAHRVEIPKPSGGVRTLSIPPLADRVVERALLSVLDPEIDPTLLPWSFAYRRGLGAKDAVAALTEGRDSGLGWVARGDVDDCFDRIPRWDVLRRLRELVDDERVVHLVGMILDRRVTGGRASASDRGRGLLQGSVLSPLLSNLYLDTFDRAMMAAGFRVIRYGDDFAIPVASRADGERALTTAGTELAELRLELGTDKCHVTSFDEGVRFLGETVTASTINAGETISHPLETVVYVDRQGALVRSRGDRMIVTDGEESLLRLNLRRIRQVVCYGRVGLTTAFLHRAAERGIEIVLLHEQGTLGARLTAPASSDPTVRRAQYRAADDDRRARRLATGFVDGKLSNLRVTLLRVARREQDTAAAEAATRLEEAGDKLSTAPSLDEVLGVEGAASRDYFQALRRMLDPEWGFTGRARRPPPDPVNAMLSYGCALPRGDRRRRGRRAGPDGRVPAPTPVGPPGAGAGPDGGVPPDHRGRRRVALCQHPPGAPRTVQRGRSEPGRADGLRRQAHLPRRLREADAHPHRPRRDGPARVVPGRAITASQGARRSAARPRPRVPATPVEVSVS
ncbi:MAG: CRISPR-associated endonuclease Cas1 [Sciscionella sp.]